MSWQFILNLITQIRYATEVDVDFVRKAVRSIGRLAIKVDDAAKNCIQALLELIENKVSYVVQEAIIVIRDIFRRYPGRYEGIIPALCQHLDQLDEPEAKSAMIWVIGQYANIIENADELLDDLLYTFLEEAVEVWLVIPLQHLILIKYRYNWHCSRQQSNYSSTNHHQRNLKSWFTRC